MSCSLVVCKVVVKNTKFNMSGLVTTAVIDAKIGKKLRTMKIDYNAKISGNEKKYFTTFDYNKFTKRNT